MPTPQIKLIAIKDGEELGRWSLAPGAYTIRSAASCSMRIGEERVAPEHARLLLAEDGPLLLQPRGAGVTLDGQALEGDTSVRPNQTIGLADVQILVQQRISESSHESRSRPGSPMACRGSSRVNATHPARKSPAEAWARSSMCGRARCGAPWR